MIKAKSILIFNILILTIFVCIIINQDIMGGSVDYIENYIKTNITNQIKSEAELFKEELNITLYPILNKSSITEKRIVLQTIECGRVARTR